MFKSLLKRINFIIVLLVTLFYFFSPKNIYALDCNIIESLDPSPAALGQEVKAILKQVSGEYFVTFARPDDSHVIEGRRIIDSPAGTIVTLGNVDAQGGWRLIISGPPTDDSCQSEYNLTVGEALPGRATCPAGSTPRCFSGDLPEENGCRRGGTLTRTDPATCIPTDGSPEFNPRTRDPISPPDTAGPPDDAAGGANQCIASCVPGYSLNPAKDSCSKGAFSSTLGSRITNPIPGCTNPKWFPSETDINNLAACTCSETEPTSKDKQISGCSENPTDPKFCPDSLGIRCNLTDGSFVAITKGKPVPAGLGIMTALGCIPTEPQTLVESLLKYGILASGGIAFLIMVLGALQMITAEGNPEAIKHAQERFYSAIIGLLLVIFSVLLMQFIGFNILGLPPFSK